MIRATNRKHRFMDRDFIQSQLSTSIGIGLVYNPQGWIVPLIRSLGEGDVRIRYQLSEGTGNCRLEPIHRLGRNCHADFVNLFKRQRVISKAAARTQANEQGQHHTEGDQNSQHDHDLFTCCSSSSSLFFGHSYGISSHLSRSGNYLQVLTQSTLFSMTS